MATTSPRSPRVKSKRITRSISFENGIMEYLKRRARAEKRTVNWLVNETVRKDLELVKR